MSDPLPGIGIIGVGGIAQEHLKAYQARGFRVVAGCDSSDAALATVQERFGVPVITKDVAEFLQTPGLDVVDLAVPHYLEIRRPLVEAIARSGKALFCQKPLDETLAGAKLLTGIVQAAGIPFAVNQNSPFVPGFVAAQKVALDRARLGDPYWFQIENRGSLWFTSHPHWGTRDRWIVSGMAVHHLALMHHWFGMPARVWATMARDPGKPFIKAENVAALGLEYASGLKGLIINNWSYAGPRPRGHPREEIVVQGTQGVLTFDTKELTFQPASGTPYTEATAGEWFPDAFGESMRAFLGSLAGGPPHPSAGAEDLKVMATVEAAYRSSAEGRAIAPADLLAENPTGGTH